MFQNDPEVDRILLIGEIGGQEELQAATYIKLFVTKPVFAYIAGHHAPEGVQLGHAGALLGSVKESAAAKTEALENAGAQVTTSITQLINLATQ
jgi:succinyl-CoA synthetase alpha subunit